MRKLLQKILAKLARLTLAKFKPRIVGITGSVGKTSTKEAIGVLLMSKYRVRMNSGNYNNEIGLPLAILGQESGYKNLFLWVWIFIKSLILLLSSNYPEVLVLELGADRPGDIAYLVDLLKDMEVGVISSIGVSHLEFFGTVEQLAKEKLSLIKKLKISSWAVLNFDSPKVFEGQGQTKAQVLGFGFTSSAQLKASDFQIIAKDKQWGSNFKVHYQGTVVPFFLPEVLGKPGVYAALAAVGVGLKFKINLVEASEALKSYRQPAGRLRLIKGSKQSQILDDSYNAAPDSTMAALDVLNTISKSRKILVLGEMAELGKKNESGHREVANKILELKIDLVFLIGENTKIVSEHLYKNNFAGKIFWFETSQEAIDLIRQNLQENDYILVKGSQSVRTEKIVKAIMASPSQAANLLVRQGKKWLQL